jgi:exopolysaccharide biosynthesis protein
MKKKILLTIILTILIIPIVSGESPVLKNTTGWEIDSLAPGMIWYKYNRKYNGTNQRINVLEVDLQRPEYNLEIKFASSFDSLSNVASASGAVAATNGTYELDASFIRSNGVTYSQPSREVQNPTHLRHWKYEGAFFIDLLTKSVDIQYRANEQDGYYSSSYQNIISAAPVLILNYNAVGTIFTGNISGLNLNSLDYEDYRRHQGVRHPRTAIAIMDDGKVLLITVDGRRTVAEGFNAKEFTEFLVEYFNPKHALNLDGGGSTTMYLQGQSGYNNNGIVNCPVDGKAFKQRALKSFILIKKNISNNLPTQNNGQDITFKREIDGLSISSDKEIESITLYNITGQKIFEEYAGSKQYHLPKIQSGIYVAEVYLENNNRCLKKIILK